jgi:hypothetical protein
MPRAKAKQAARQIAVLPPLTTPDGRYLVVRDRLWRATNPTLSAKLRETLVKDLMDARRNIKNAKRKQDAKQLAANRLKVNKAKVSLGERGKPWWEDGAKDFNRYLVKNTPYAEWYSNLSGR